MLEAAVAKYLPPSTKLPNQNNSGYGAKPGSLATIGILGALQDGNKQHIA